MTKYKQYAIVDGKARWVVVDKSGMITNKSPNKEELKDAKIKHDQRCGYREYRPIYTDDCLLNYLKLFYEKNGKIPKASDFLYNPEYPSFVTYQKRFGNWNNGLILAKLGIREKDKIYTTTLGVRPVHWAVTRLILETLI